MSGRQADADRRLYVVSYAGVDRSWALWVRYWLERVGCEVRLKRWDLNPGSAVKDGFEDLLSSGEEIILLLSSWYFRLGQPEREEWNLVLRSLSSTERDRIRAFMINDVDLPSAVALLRPEELTDITESGALARLLRAVAPSAPLPDVGLPTGLVAPDRPRYPGTPAAVWDGIPRRNRIFTGRQELLDQTRERLLPDGRGLRPCVLVGPPGVGKSQAAAEFAHRNSTAYDLVYWVRAETRSALRTRFAALAGLLGLEISDEIGDQIRAVRDALRTGQKYRDWLVVFDGAEDWETLSEVMPEGAGHVLITSTSRDWPGAGVVDVRPFNEPEAVAYVRRRAPRLGPAEAVLLAKEMERHPLTLDQTAGWLQNSETTVGEYIERIRAELDSDEVKVTSSDYPRTLRAVMAIKLEQLGRTDSTSADVLRLCSVFGPGPLLTRLIRPTAAASAPDLPGGLRAIVSDPIRLDTALSRLVSRSLLSVDYAENRRGDIGRVEGVEMHRMIKQAVRANMGTGEGDQLEQMERAARQLLAAADPGTPEDPHSWVRYAEIVPHLLACGAHRSSNPVIQELVINALRYLYMRGEYRAAQELGDRTAEAWDAAEDGRQYPRYWELHFHRANNARALGSYQSSLEISRSVVASLQAEPDANNREYVRAAGGYAADLRALGRYREAREQSAEILETAETELGEDDPATLRARNNLAVSLRLLGRFKESFELSRPLFAAAGQVMGYSHPHTQLFASGVARDLRLLGRYDDARERQESTYGWCVQVLGSRHPVTLVAAHDLGLCLRRAGHLVPAADLLRRAAEQYARLLGPEHPEALTARADLGNYLRVSGSLRQARAIAEEVREGFGRVLGADHPFTLGAASNLALVHREEGERERAVELIDGVVEQLATQLEEGHPWVIGALLNASSCHHLSGEVESAKQLSEEARRRATERLGADHPMTLSCTVALAADLRALNRRDLAEPLERHALERLSATLGGDHVHTRAARTRERPYWDIEFLPT